MGRYILPIRIIIVGGQSSLSLLKKRAILAVGKTSINTLVKMFIIKALTTRALHPHELSNLLVAMDSDWICRCSVSSVKTRDDCSFCCYSCIWWPSLFKLSLHKISAMGAPDITLPEAENINNSVSLHSIITSATCQNYDPFFYYGTTNLYHCDRLFRQRLIMKAWYIRLSCG